MRLGLFLFAFFFVTLTCAQKEYKGIVFDKDEKEPIEFVGVYNDQDYTISNTDGEFRFTTGLDSVIFYRIGYKKLQLSLNELTDIVYLEKSLFELDEVVVTNAKTIYEKIKDSIATNYLLKPHTETFFLRAVLRRNDTIVRLQDLQGRVRRKTSIYTQGLEMDKNDFVVELQNMRQLGITKDKDAIYFQFPSLYNIWSESVRLNAMGPDFEVIEKPYENSDEIMVEFSDTTTGVTAKSNGHYIINGNDNAILSFNAKTEVLHPADVTSADSYSRWLKGEVSMFFTEDAKANLYYMNLAKRKGAIAVKSKRQSTATKFEIEIILQTTQSLGSEEVKSNVNEQKDIFKLKFPYNEAYWQSQNQLLLTKEMSAFIQRMGANNRQFKVRSNLD